MLLVAGIILIVYNLLISVDFLYDFVGERLQGAINGVLGLGGELDGSTAERIGLVEKGMGWFYERPWFGYGLNGFYIKHAQEFNYSYYAHNNFVEMLVDLGIVGFAIYYSLYAYIFIKGIKALKKYRDRHAKFFFALFVGSLISEYARVVYYSPQGQFVIMLCLFVFTHMPCNAEEEVKNA